MFGRLSCSVAPFSSPTLESGYKANEALDASVACTEASQHSTAPQLALIA